MGVEISIKAGLDTATSSVSASGSLQHIITDLEVKSFGITDSQLKDAVNKYFGARPDDAYLHSDTPWGDLYKTYQWPQVETVLVVESATITGITSEPEMISHQNFKNSSSHEGTFDCSIYNSVTNTTDHTWSQSNSIEISQTFKYSVEFLGTGGGGETALKYNHTWGESKSESTSVEVGRRSGVTVNLDPGQEVLAELTASRGSMNIRIVYKAYLTGCTAINYGGTYQGHHFWSLPIDQVMNNAGISNYKTITEDIKIGFYANSCVEIKDPKNGNLQAKFVAARPGINPVNV
jgi:hypothetical protein